MSNRTKKALLPLVLTLALAFWAGVIHADDDDEPIALSEVRKDIARKELEFFELEVPTRDGGKKKIAVTVLETFDREVFDEALYYQPAVEDQQERDRLRSHVVETVQDWYERHLSEKGPGGKLDEKFRATLHNEQSIYRGNNTVIVFSNPDDFADIYALLRVAKRSPVHPRLPVERQLGEKLNPLPNRTYRRVPDGRLKLYSYRHEKPHYMMIQNVPLYRGDAVELKHYSAVRDRDVDLTALLFHVAQEIGALSVVGLRTGNDIGVREAGVLVTPHYFVAESDNPAVIKQLTGFGFSVHQELPGTIHPDRTTQILIGTQEQFAKGFYAWNQNRRNSWQLPEAKLLPRQDKPFLRSLLGARCSEMLINALHRLDARVKQRLQTAIDAATR